MRFLTKLRRWQFVAIVIVLFVVAAGAFVVYRGTSTQNSAEIEEDQQIIPIRRGDLIKEISITGSLSLPNRETLTFGSSGVVADIMVEEGDKVTAGQTLAVLDQEDISALDEKVIQARVALRDAEEELKEYLSPSALDIANARKEIADTVVRLQDAIDALYDLSKPPSPVSISQIEANIVSYQVELDKIAEDIADLQEPPTQLQIDQTRKNISGARLELERAQDDLEETQKSPTQLQIDQAKKNVYNARLELERAEEALEDAQTDDPDEIDEIQNARNRIDSAARELSYSEANLDVVYREWDVKLADARSDVADRADAYGEPFSKWLGISADPATFNPYYEMFLSDLGVNLESLFDLSTRFSDLDQGGYYSDGLPLDNPSTAWNEPTVFLWLNLSPTEIVVTCEPDDTPRRGACIQEEFRVPSQAYVSALDNLAEMEVQSDKSVSAAKTAFERAQNTLNTAQTALEELTEPTKEAVIADMTAAVQLAKSRLDDTERQIRELTEPEEAVIADMTTAVQLARSRLADAETDLQELTESEDVSLSVENLGAQADLARANLQQAKDDLEDLLAEADPTELVAIAALQEDIEVARLDLDDKRQDLEDLISRDPESLDLAVLQVNVASASVALSQAEERLANATITAPWDGFVAKLDVEEGDEVERHTNIMVVVDTGVVEVDGGVDEIDVLQAQVGAEASVEIDALPDQTITGAVSFIAAEPDSGQGGQGGIVSYPVRIRLTVPDGVDLPAGLSAVASITTSEERGALLVPLNALRGSFNRPTLNVMKDGVVVETPVTLGESDEFWTVVTGGVREGDMVVMQAPEGSEGEFNVTGGPRGGGGGRRPPR